MPFRNIHLLGIGIVGHSAFGLMFLSEGGIVNRVFFTGIETVETADATVMINHTMLDIDTAAFALFRTLAALNTIVGVKMNAKNRFAGKKAQKSSNRTDCITVEPAKTGSNIGKENQKKER